MATKLLTLLGLLFAASAVGAEEAAKSWAFTSLYGQKYSITQNAKDQYSISVLDVTEAVRACKARSYRVCFSSRYLSVAVPKEPPGKNSSWIIGPSTFSVRALVEESRILGHQLRGLYIIDVQREPVPPLDTVAHRFRLFFTYADGLVAFAVQDERGELVEYLASRLPSLGAGSQ